MRPAKPAASYSESGSSGSGCTSRSNSSTRSVVHVATPAPKKSASSVQTGHSSASAVASTGQSLHHVSASVAALQFQMARRSRHRCSRSEPPAQRARRERVPGSIPSSQNAGKMLPGLGEGSIRREESDSRGMRFEDLSNTLAQDCANQYVRVENHQFRSGPFDGYGVLP